MPDPDYITWEDLRREDQWRQADLLTRLDHLPHEFDFFGALRQLDEWFARQQYPRIGCSRSRAGDPIHFGQRPFLEFAPRTIDKWSREQLSECRFAKPTMLVYFMGLFGTNGPMPLNFTEIALQRQRHGDFTLTNFANIFQHRFISFFYRAWASTRIAPDLDRPEQQRFASFIGSFFGEGAKPTQLREEEFQFHYRHVPLRSDDLKSPAIPERVIQGNFSETLALQSRDWPKLLFAGRLAAQVRNAEGLQSIVEHYFGLPATIQTFFGRWFDLPLDNVCHLRASPQNCLLGQTVIAGTKFWDCQMSFRIRLGPMKLADFQRLLPGGESFERLKRWVYNYIGWQLQWDVQLVLSKEAVPETKLGDGGLLGWTTFLHPGSLEFWTGDIINVDSFAAKLKQPATDDGVSQYLRTQLSGTTQNFLSNYSTGASSQLQQALVEDLNRIMQNGSIYESQRFAGIRLSPKTSDLLARKPRGLDLVPLNLALLLDAYPLDLAKIPRPFDQDSDDLVISPDVSPGSATFSVGDLKDLPSFASKLKAPSRFTADNLKDLVSLATKLDQQLDPVSAYMNSKLSDASRQALANYRDSVSNPGPLRTALVTDLNKIIQGELIFDAQRFAGITLRSETQQLLAQQSPEGGSIRLNRLLLEDAYPLEIAKTNAVSTYLNAHLSVATQNALANYSASSSSLGPLQAALVEDLNKIITGQSIYEAHRFAGVTLRAETRRFLYQSPQGENLVRQNRLLLEDAYPQDISRNQNLWAKVCLLTG